VLPENAIVRHT